MRFSDFRGSRMRRGTQPTRFATGVAVLTSAAALLLTSVPPTAAQNADCERLQARIAQLDHSGGDYAKAARKQAGELSRTQAYAHQLGCDRGGFLFFGGGNSNPQCSGLNARISQMQANYNQLQAAGGGGMRNDLVARYNAYCRGAPPPHERGFFESIFGGGQEEPRPGPLPDLPPDETQSNESGPNVHGGAQAVCVRTCDGGFFPLPISSHHSAEDLNQMCEALCPGTEAKVYTRNPNAEIKTAVGLDGKPYVDLPNALKFQKVFTPTCSCRPAGKSWAEALANAEEVIGNQHKGDILVTQEKSDEMSRPRLDPKARAALLAAPGTTKVSPQDADQLAANPPALKDATEVTGPDGVKRLVRHVGPQD